MRFLRFLGKLKYLYLWIPVSLIVVVKLLRRLGYYELAIPSAYTILLAIHFLNLPFWWQVAGSVLCVAVLVYFFYISNVDILSWLDGEVYGALQVAYMFVGATVIATWGSPPLWAIIDGILTISYAIVVAKEFSWKTHLGDLEAFLDTYPRRTFWVLTGVWALLHWIFPVIAMLHLPWIALNAAFSLVLVWVIWWRFMRNPSGHMRVGSWQVLLFLLIAAVPVGETVWWNLQPAILFLAADFALVVILPPISHHSVRWLHEPAKGWNGWYRFRAALGIVFLLAAFAGTWWVVGIQDWRSPQVYGYDQNGVAILTPTPPDPIIGDAGRALDNVLSQDAGCSGDYSGQFGVELAFLETQDGSSAASATTKLHRIESSGFFVATHRTDRAGNAIVLDQGKVETGFNAYLADPLPPSDWRLGYPGSMNPCIMPSPNP